MAATEKLDVSSEDLQLLKNQNAVLQKQVELLQAESTSYRLALQSWAKEHISEEVVQGWMSEGKVEGSLLDFIDQVRGEK